VTKGGSEVFKKLFIGNCAKSAFDYKDHHVTELTKNFDLNSATSTADQKSLFDNGK
jgi:hypothetical protein